MYIICQSENIVSILETNMTKLRSNLADALDQATSGGVVLVKRPNGKNAAIIDGDLLEDYLAATNPRVIKKVAEARSEKHTIPFDEVFADVL